ncbi:MAG: type II toxin-antitoxin system VapC family toxin [Candidatus Binatia bacterium]|jgi:predicted nucleic acid-binding protein
MAVSVTGKVLLDTNVFIDYLRADLHANWIFGGLSNTIRFLSSVVLMELRLGADTVRRRRAVDRIQVAFPSGRLIAPLPILFDHAGRLFRALHGDGSELADQLGPVNDLLIALTARHMGATVVTSNVEEFKQIAAHVPGLKIIAPKDSES